MSNSEVTTKRPEPPESDFAFVINFKKGEAPASRVFSATSEFINACERLDRQLVSSIDANIETVMVLEDVTAGSLKTHLRTALHAIDDQALKSLNWKPAVGKYLVRSKYTVLRWFEDDKTPRSLPELRREIQKLAAETDVRHIPDYAPVSAGSLINAAKDFDRVKDHLSPDDSAAMIVSEDEEASFNIKNRLDVDAIEALAISETQIHTVSTMVLIVKKPDYLGSSMWDFRYGNKPIPAKIEDGAWLNTFQDRGIDIRPGDALRCEVRIEVSYGHDNELLAEKYFVTRVHQVVENQFDQDVMDV